MEEKDLKKFNKRVQKSHEMIEDMYKEKTLSNEIEYGLIFEDRDKQKEEITLELKEPILFISNVKHHIKLVQQKLIDRTRDTINQIARPTNAFDEGYNQAINDLSRAIMNGINKIFLEEFGPKLMEDKE